MTYADTIYVNADIVTVADHQLTAEALAVADGRILAVGSRAEIEALAGPQTKRIDLEGRTLVPGFVDAHSHFMNALQIVQWANVSAPPVGPVTCIADIVRVMAEQKAKQAAKPGDWIIGYGYDANTLAEQREATVDDLDPHFPDNPIMLIHVSNHGAVLNSAAFRLLGITAATPTPPGGVILRKPGSQEPAGLLMETAFLPLFAKMPQPGEDEMLARFAAAQEIYARAGVTTAQEGASFMHDVALLEKAAAQGRLIIDVVSYVIITDLEKLLETHPASTFGKYSNRLKLGGTKIVTDGSPQGRTAFFTKPYLTGGPGGEENWRGEPSFPPEVYNKFVKLAYDNGLHVLSHCNGDAAIDMLLAGHEYAAADNLDAERRTTVIHSQFVRPDQLEKYVKYKFMVSFYTEHAFFFGETHLRNLGKERAEFLSPMRTALDMGLHCTNHTDFSVEPIDQLFTIWTAVNRVTRGGQLLGPEQRVTPLEALRAVTIESAYEAFEETTKGSLEPGKLADMVVLSANPLKVDPMTIKDIQVLETIKEGRTIWSADSDSQPGR